MEIYDKKHFLGQVLKSFIIFFSCFTVALAQSKKVTIKLLSEEPVVEPRGVVQRVLITREKKAISGHLLRVDRKLFLSFPDRPKLELPHRLDTIVSQDGKTILQFGDEIRLFHPRRTDLYWMNQMGEVINSLSNHYAERARISISDDGYVGVAGQLKEKPEIIALDLYFPYGKRIWGINLPESQRIDSLVVTPEGQYVVAIITHRKNLLKGHQLQIRHKNGDVSAAISEMGILQKLVLLRNNNKVFLQGYDTYGMVDIQTGELIWKRSGKIRMISPYGAALSPDGGILFLLLADLGAEAESTYRWKFLIMDSKTGEELTKIYLPQKYPSTWEKVYEQISENEIRILAGNQRVKYSWRKQ